VKTKDGPRFRIEGDAHVGQFLGLEGQPDVAVQNGRPQRESNARRPTYPRVLKSIPVRKSLREWT
jgi:hypothetical protein